MTVLDTRDPYIQYTGTGQRLYFEYGFVWSGETVVVEVDGVPVSFEYQANGVLLEVAPALNAEIVIWRETDITQERDFTAFDAFVGSWTEDALDKLILLKQEAAIWRAQTNLRANHKLDRVTIENTQGTDPDIFLWNLDQSGVFAGEVTTAMPAVGQVVAKPWDFAYFQYGAEEPAGPFVDYEYMLFSTTDDYLVRYIALDYTTNTVTDFGSFYAGGEQSIITDGDTLIRTAGSGVFVQYHWRGTCFTQTYSEDLGYTNSSDFMIRLDGMDNQFVVCGVYGFGRGFAVVDYEPSREETLDLATAYGRNPGTGSVWNGMWDLRTASPGLPLLGDAVFLAGDTDGTNTTKLYTYEQDITNVLQVADASSIAINTVPSDWGVDRDDGWAAKRSGNGFILYSIDMGTLQITTIGTCTSTTDPVFAVVPVPETDGDMFLTSETSGITHTLRTYSRTGTVLALLDELTQPSSNTNSNVRFWVSPYSNRIWLQGVGSQDSLHVSVDTGTGAITVPFTIPYGSGSSGYRGSFIGFLQDPMTVWTNGYTGIKQKLFQAWEMEETGNNTRTYSFSDNTAALVELVKVGAGNLSNIASDVGFACVFDGNSALGAVCSVEMGTTGTFSLCLDVTLGSKATDQAIVVRARSNWYSTNPQNQDFVLMYDQALDKFKFYTRWGVTAYAVTADDVGAIATGTKYHIYVEFNKAEAKNKIRVNGGTLYEVASNVNINRYPFAYLHVGRRTSWSGLQQYLSAGSEIDQFFWFWDALTEAQQDYMENGGNSRAFSEL